MGTSLSVEQSPGGSINIASSSHLIPSGTWDGVTINGDFLVASNTGVTIKNGLTLNGTATAG